MDPSEEQPRAAAAAEEKEEAGGGGGGGGYQKQFVDLSVKNPLKPRRRAQIEVWLDETVGLWGMQHCAAGASFGHRSDLMASSTAAADHQPGGGLRPVPVDVDGDDEICPVCGRSPEGEKEPPVATQPDRGKSRPDAAGPGKGKHVLRGILSAVGRPRARGGGRVGEDKEDKGWDRAVSTHMFLAEPSQYGSSVSTGSGSSGPFGKGGGKKAAAECKALEERMARLARAQKLLDRSQATR